MPWNMATFVRHLMPCAARKAQMIKRCFDNLKIIKILWHSRSCLAVGRNSPIGVCKIYLRQESCQHLHCHSSSGSLVRTNFWINFCLFKGGVSSNAHEYCEGKKLGLVSWKIS